MSLLLDALKKAAEDKEKNSPKVEPVETKAEKDTEEYPEIDEELISEDLEKSEQNNLTEQEEDFDLELPVEIGDDEPESEIEIDLAQSLEKEPVKEEVEGSIVEEKDVDVVSETSPEIILEPTSDHKLGLSADLKVSKEKPPAYDQSDARKILSVAQNRYRNKQRIGYYSLYAFAACLFFAGSYLYYTTEILDNSDRPVFQAKSNNNSVPKSPAEIKIEKQVSIAKAKLVEMNAIESKQSKIAVVEKKKGVVAPKQKSIITIRKQKKEDPISFLLQQAYEKYLVGQYESSDLIYKKVLQRDTRQLDALMGIAAIAVVKKEYVIARDYYQRILRYYPRNSIAKSALVDLARQEISVANESQLKSLKRTDPKAAHIHFSLGLLYAKKNRLNESQQAFFDAYALDKRADYAYNLAVMLDKLGQPKAALSYYKQASNLSDNNVSYFNEKLALDRIRQLEGE